MDQRIAKDAAPRDPDQDASLVATHWVACPNCSPLASWVRQRRGYASIPRARMS